MNKTGPNQLLCGTQAQIFVSVLLTPSTTTICLILERYDSNKLNNWPSTPIEIGVAKEPKNLPGNPQKGALDFLRLSGIFFDISIGEVLIQSTFGMFGFLGSKGTSSFGCGTVAFDVKKK